jgi:hypothetical protein
VRNRRWHGQLGEAIDLNRVFGYEPHAAQSFYRLRSNEETLEKITRETGNKSFPSRCGSFHLIELLLTREN